MKKYSIFLLLVIGFISYKLYPLFYTVIDEALMDIPKCDLSNELANDNYKANAGCLVIGNNKSILLMLGKVHGHDQYSIPGGTSKLGEVAACTAHRETFEETGIDVKVLTRIDILENGFHLFECEPKGIIDLTYSKKYETDKILFLPVDQIINYRYPNELKLISDYIAKKERLKID